MQGFKTRLDQKFRASDRWPKWEKRLKILTFISVYMEYVPTLCELVSLILLQPKLLQCCLQVNHLRVIAVLQFITHWPLCVPVQLTFVKGQCFAAKCHHWIFFSCLFLVEHEQSFHLITPVVWQNVPLNKLMVTHSSQGVIKMLRRCWNIFGWLEASKWEVKPWSTYVSRKWQHQ